MRAYYPCIGRPRGADGFGIVAAVILLSSLTTGPSLGADVVRITEGSTVTIDFTVTLPNKKVVTSTEGKEPLSYVQGQGRIAPGLEKALLGLKAGDRKRVEVAPDQAYGPYDNKKRFTVGRNQVPGDAKVGSILQGQDGQPLQVVEMTESSVVLDQNHPLAGKVVTFDVKILNVEPPEQLR